MNQRLLCKAKWVLFSVLCREQVTLSWNDNDDVFFVLDKHAELDVHSASSLHNSTRVNMSSHLKTLLVDVLIWTHTLLIPWNIFNCLVTLGIIIALDDHAYRHLLKALIFGCCTSEIVSTFFKLIIYLISLWCILNICNAQYLSRARVRVMTFNATFNNISVI